VSIDRQGTVMTTSATIPASEITYLREGEGQTAVVFLHGFFEDQYVWNRVIAELPPNFEKVQLELAGFGQRTSAEGPFTYDRFAADLFAVVDALDKPIALVGTSMSAPIIELVAAGRPEKVIGLVLVAPIPMDGVHVPDEVIEQFRRLGTLSEPEARIAREQTAPTVPSAELDRTVSVNVHARPEAVRTIANLWNDGYPTGGKKPSRFTGPVLVLPGTDDPLITPEVIASLVAPRFTADTLTVTPIENAAHWPHLEQPSAVATNLAKFLAANPVGTAVYGPRP
jgi:pimeloyl-ACP methyl ester carboxylesterase